MESWITFCFDFSNWTFILEHPKKERWDCNGGSNDFHMVDTSRVRIHE